MVSVKFYKTNSESIDTNKDLQHIQDENIIFKDDFNILNFTIKMSNNIDCNYAYIADLHRYYYVQKEILIGGQYNYIFNVDVAMSFKNQIKNITCTVLRNENISNAYLHDSEYKTLAYKKYVTKSFPSGLNDDCIILNTIGG